MGNIEVDQIWSTPLGDVIIINVWNGLVYFRYINDGDYSSSMEIDDFINNAFLVEQED